MSDTDFVLPPNARSAKPGVKPPSRQVKPEAETPAPEAKAEDTPPTNPKRKTYEQEELLRVFDEIIFQQEYSEEMSLRGRFKATFRTRTSDEVNQIQNAIDKSGFTLISSVENLRMVLNLSFALVAYNGESLPLQLAGKRAFVDKLPGPVVGMLLNALNNFDDKVAQACIEGDENF